MMRDGSYVVIQAFMVNDLHLKGNELIVYATVYGFTQDGEHWFHGTRGYLAEWCGCTKDTAGNCLKTLVGKGLLERRERHEMGQTFVDYRAVPPMKKTATPYEKTSTPHPKNQPINKIEDKPKEQPTKERKKPSTFDAIIAERTDNERLREVIGEFIRMRSRIKKPLTNYALQLRLSKLWRLGSTDEERIAIVEQSVGACWQDFFPLKDDAPKSDRRSQYTEEQNQEFDQYSWDADQITYL